MKYLLAFTSFHAVKGETVEEKVNALLPDIGMEW
jgi:hypothetical protein